MTLTELKAKATELGLTPDEVRQHGNLSYKATWESAIAQFKPIPEPSTDIAVTVNQPSVDDLPFDNPTHTLINGEWVLVSEINTATDDCTKKSQPIPPLTPLGETNQLSDCLESPTPIRDQLFLKMMGKGLSLSDLEQLQNEPLDEDTAVVFLTLLEEGERMRSEALAL